MAPYQLTVAYDGTDFYGFQRQKNKRTIQAELEKALRKIGWQEKSILSAGRTDSGVHAEGHVVSFTLDWDHRPGDLINALNDHLPGDVAVKSAKIVQDGFHPRFDARNRKYRYQMVFFPTREPLLERYHWRVWPKPDQNLVAQGTAKILGCHDFASIGKPPREKTTTIRTIQSANWRFEEDKERAFFTISAEAFLYHMVRRIVFLLVCVGQKKIDAADLEKSLLGQVILPAGIAPAQGLFLEEINY